MTFWPQSSYRLKEAFAIADICASTVYTAGLNGPVLTAALVALIACSKRKILSAMNPLSADEEKKSLRNQVLTAMKASPVASDNKFQRMANKISKKWNLATCTVAYASEKISAAYISGLLLNRRPFGVYEA
jgi:hypothetical protein